MRLRSLYERIRNNGSQKHLIRRTRLLTEPAIRVFSSSIEIFPTMLKQETLNTLRLSDYIINTCSVC